MISVEWLSLLVWSFSEKFLFSVQRRIAMPEQESLSYIWECERLSHTFFQEVITSQCSAKQHSSRIRCWNLNALKGFLSGTKPPCFLHSSSDYFKVFLRIVGPVMKKMKLTGDSFHLAFNHSGIGVREVNAKQFLFILILVISLKVCVLNPAVTSQSPRIFSLFF